MVEQFEPKYAQIKVKDGLIKSMNSFFMELLANSDLDGILIPQELPGGSGFVPALTTDPDLLLHANALSPIMPVNASKAVSDYARLKPSQKKIAVVLKPCEIRSAVELTKLHQVNMENLVIIGVDCPGTVSIQHFSESKDKKKVANELIKCYSKSEESKDLRSACSACEFFSPGVADIIVGLYGQNTNKQFLIGINSPIGEGVVSELKLTFTGTDSLIKNRTKAISKLEERRLNYTKELEASTEKRISGLENFMTELSSCINCHNCMTVCPICYCRECFFESPTFDLDPEKYFKIADHKGSLRLPANMFLFHVTRFNHMVLSCIACGMCEQGCPANIPLLSIYKTVGKNAQKVFDYEPGRDLEEEIPILTFKEDELEPR
jgi:formate dehydrogenase subunit beta